MEPSARLILLSWLGGLFLVALALCAVYLQGAQQLRIASLQSQERQRAEQRFEEELRRRRSQAEASRDAIDTNYQLQLRSQAEERGFLTPFQEAKLWAKHHSSSQICDAALRYKSLTGYSIIYDPKIRSMSELPLVASVIRQSCPDAL